MNNPNNPFQQQGGAHGQAQGGYGQPFGGGLGPAPGRPPQYGYEFRPDENEVLRKAANAAKFLGIVFFVQAGFSLIGMSLLAVAIEVVFGIMFFQGGKALMAAVETQGNDIGNLMTGLEKFSNVFLVRLIFVGIMLGLIVLVMLGALALLAAAG